jgi:hypothetical protein
LCDILSLLKAPLVRDPRENKFDVVGKMESLGFGEKVEEKIGVFAIISLIYYRFF